MLRPPVGELPSLKLTTTDAIPQPNNMFFADARKSASGKRLADTFVNPPGVGRWSLVFLNCCVFLDNIFSLVTLLQCTYRFSLSS